MPEFYDKTGHGLTDIMIAWAKFKPVLHPELFGKNDKYIYWVRDWTWRPSTMVGSSVKFLFRIEVSSLA